MTWYYKGKEFTEENVSDYVGFVYIITDKSSNRMYIGQKIFWNKVSKKPLKGKVNRRLSKKPSNWQQYYGSNDNLKLLVEQNGESGYNREIIHLCKSKGEMNYLETKEIFSRDALLNKNYFNEWVKARIHRSQLNGIQL